MTSPIPDEWRNHGRYILALGWYGFGYWLRSLFVRPAPAHDRCVMGCPVHPWVWCPRYAVGNGLWCKKHEE